MLGNWVIDNIIAMYDAYIEAKNQENFQNRYEGKEEYYHGSASGSCARKLYYQIAQAPESNPMNDATKRKLRLGTIFHSEMEDCVNYYVNSTGTLELTGTKSLGDFSILKVTQEEEIVIPSVNVRGFFDLLVETTDNELILIDYKTIATYPYKLKFGKNSKPSTNLRYELQMGTYGYAIREKYGRLDGMYLLYYNKDDSRMTHVSVPLKYLDIAYQYWKLINNLHAQGLPPIDNGVSPVEQWECNYCNYKDLCKGKA